MTSVAENSKLVGLVMDVLWSKTGSRALNFFWECVELYLTAKGPFTVNESEHVTGFLPTASERGGGYPGQVQMRGGGYPGQVQMGGGGYPRPGPDGGRVPTPRYLPPSQGRYPSPNQARTGEVPQVTFPWPK